MEKTITSSSSDIQVEKPKASFLRRLRSFFFFLSLVYLAGFGFLLLSRADVPILGKLLRPLFGQVEIQGQIGIQKGLEVDGNILLHGDLLARGHNADFGTGSIIASNILYGINPGAGIAISGKQTPTITNTGVLSVGGKKGAVALAAGTGITINDLAITNQDPGSAQNIFKKITVGGSNIFAGNNVDTLTFATGGGLSLSADTNAKSLTFSSTSVSSQWTTTGSNIYYNSGSIGIGNTSPAKTLDLTGTFGVSGAVTLSVFSINGGLLLTNASGGVIQSTAGLAGECLQSNGGGLPTWASCGTDYWQLNSGALSPGNLTFDFLVGGTASSSATLHAYGAGPFQGTKPSASISANSSFAALVVDNKGVGDLFTASSSGLNRFVIAQSGNVGIGIAAPTVKLQVAGGNILLDNNTSLQWKDNVGTATNVLNVDTFNQLAYGGAGFVGNYYQSGGTQYWQISGTYYMALGTNGLAINNGSTVATAGNGLIVGSGRVGFGTASPLGSLDVRPNTTNGATTAIASVSGSTNFAGFLVDNTGSGDLLTASKSGATKFTILNNGNLSWAGATNFLSTFASAATVAQTWTLPDATGTLCVSGSSCATSGTVGYFQRNAGALSPANITDDLLLGATSTGSARFAFTNAVGPGTPVASISATTTGLVLGGDGSVQSLRNGTLTLGGSTTGHIDFAAGGSTVDMTLTSAGSLGIGTAAPEARLHVSGGNILVDNARSLQWKDNVGTATNVINADSFNGLAYGAVGFTANYYGSGGAHYWQIGGAYYMNLGTTGLAINNGSTTTTAGNGLIVGSGRVGFGTTSPLGSLDVRPNTTNGATIAIASISGSTNFAAMVADNTGTGDLLTASKSGSTKFVIKNDGSAQIWLNAQLVGKQRLCHDGVDGSNQGLVTLGDCDVTAADYAEDYGTSDVSMEAGDVVVVDSARDAEEIIKNGKKSSKAWVVKSDKAYQSDTLGIVSTNPYETLGHDLFTADENPRPVALNGRVPVKISGASEKIKRGDPITSSDESGKAMKATGTGQIIGKALENWDPANPPASGKIIVFVNTSWYDPGFQSGLAYQSDVLGASVSAILHDTPEQPTSLSSNTKGLTVDGDATVTGDLRVQNNTLVEGILNVVDTLTTNNLIVSKVANFFGEVIFHDKVSFRGAPIFSKNTVGVAKILDGKESIRVVFDKAYETTPQITVTLKTGESIALQEGVLQGDIRYVVMKETKDGFMIKLNKKATEDMTFSWTAFVGE